MLSIQTLASGSSGNMTVIRSAHSTLVLDLGIRSMKGTVAALETAGIAIESLEAALVSHRHSDHLGSSGLKLCLRAGIPVLAGPETIGEAERLYRWKKPAHDPEGSLVPIRPQTTYLVGNIEVTPFSVSHDVPTYGFEFAVAGGGGRKVTVATDLGFAPDDLLPHFADADAILLEANYDEDLLRLSPRHVKDKTRVASDHGHLSNMQAGRFIARVMETSRALPQAIVLVHLSRDHNRPEMAVDDVSTYLGPGRQDGPRVVAAPRDRPGPEIVI